MTSDQFPATWSGRIIELSKIVGALSILLSTGIGIWAWGWGPVDKFFDRIDLMIQNVAQLQGDVEQLKEDVKRANGEDRVIRQPQGLSYIMEPVHEGDTVVMIAVLSRTKLGADCRLEDWTPIFTDERNIPTPGGRLRAGPVQRQINTDLVPLRIEMKPPQLRPGRITVYLTLTYRCPSKDGATVVPDRTEVLAYQLLP